MPRKTKILPPDRSAWSFGEVLYWHLFVYGTRPDGNPEKPTGRHWDPKKAAHAFGITTRSLWHWIGDKHPPFDTVAVEHALLGDDPAFDGWRIELQEKLRITRAGIDVAKANTKSGRPFWRDVVFSPSPSPEQQAGRSVPAQAESREEKPEEAAGREIVPVPPVILHPPRETPRTVRFAAPMPLWLIGFAMLLGTMSWMRSQTGEPRLPEKQVVTIKPPAEAPKPVIPVAVPPPAAPDRTPPSPAPTAPAPPGATTVPPATTTTPPTTTPPVTTTAPPREPTEQEKQLAEQKRIAEQLVAARIAGFEARKRKEDEEARRRDRQDTAALDEARERENEARTLAGLGFRSTENQSIPGTSFAHVQVETVADCALACTREGCDAFAFYRLQYPRGTKAKRYCYLYRKPFAEPANNPGYVLGLPVAQPAQRSDAPRSPIVLAQATAPAASDDLTRCSSGPVKVTGFALSCDEILGGGTAPGGQERFAVSTINDCAARCRPNKNCTGFTFNSGDPEGRRACQLFGGRPEPRESLGWISGRR